MEKVKGRNRNAAGLNEQVFDTWTAENAWALGLLTGDGSYPGPVRPQEFVLYGTDIGLLTAFRNVFGSVKPIPVSTGINGRHGRNPVGRLALSSPKIMGFLRRVEAVGNKDVRNPFVHVPEAYRWAFVRGLFDADGNCYKGFISIAGREHLITAVYEWICERLGAPRRAIYHSTNTTKTVFFQLNRTLARMAFERMDIDGLYESKKFSKAREVINKRTPAIIQA